VLAGDGATGQRGGCRVSLFLRALQPLERLGLKAIEVPTHPREGVDLSRVFRILETQQPKACWLMTNFQNPSGCSLPREKKRALVDRSYDLSNFHAVWVGFW